MADVDVGFMLAWTLHTAPQHVRRRGGAGGPVDHSGGGSAVAVLCWGATAGRLCVSVCAAWVVVCGAPGCVAMEGDIVRQLQ